MKMRKLTACAASAAMILGLLSGAVFAGETEAAVDTTNLGTLYETMPTDSVVVTLDQIEAVETDQEYTVGLAMAYGLTTPFYTTLANSFMDEAEKLGLKVLLADCESDSQVQVGKIENFIAQKVDAMVVLPCDPNDAITPVLEKVFAADIPVMTFDVPPADGAKYLATFATDAYALGYAVGESLTRMALETFPEGEIEFGIIGGVQGIPTPTNRNNGMRDAIAAVDTEGRMKEVSFLYAGAFTEESGLETGENMLIANPNMKVIFGTCDAHCIGAASAAKRQGRDDVIMGGVDGSKAAMQIMQDGGPIKVLALNSPNDMGRATARAMAAYLTNGTIPESRNMVIDGGVVTPDTVDEYIDTAF